MGLVFQNVIKRNLRLLSVLLCGGLLASFSTGWGQESQFFKANELSKLAKYDEAIALYQSVIDSGRQNGRLYYNLGYCYFRKGEVGRAIANLKKALRLFPRDSNIQANLRDMRKQVVDQIPVEKNRSILTYLFLWVHLFNDQETLWIGSLLLSLFFLLIFLTNLSPFLREYLGIPRNLVMVVTFVYCLGALLHFTSTIKNEAVVIVPEVSVKSGLGVDNVTLFTLHEGTELVVTDKNGDWLKIILTNGEKGWVHRKYIERIQL